MLAVGRRTPTALDVSWTAWEPHSVLCMSCDSLVMLRAGGELLRKDPRHVPAALHREQFIKCFNIIKSVSTIKQSVFNHDKMCKNIIFLCICYVYINLLLLFKFFMIWYRVESCASCDLTPRHLTTSRRCSGPRRPGQARPVRMWRVAGFLHLHQHLNIR